MNPTWTEDEIHAAIMEAFQGLTDRDLERLQSWEIAALIITKLKKQASE